MRMSCSLSALETIEASSRIRTLPPSSLRASRSRLDRPSASLIGFQRERLRLDTRVAFEHLNQRVLHRQAKQLVTLMAQHIGDRLQDARFASAGNTLHGNGPIT